MGGCRSSASTRPIPSSSPSSWRSSSRSPGTVRSRSAPRSSPSSGTSPRYCGTTEAVGVSSGTAALELALRGLGIGPGDEVVVPTYSFIATAEAVTTVGATPVLVDVDPETAAISAEIVEPALGPRTRCVDPRPPLRAHGRDGPAAGRSAGLAAFTSSRTPARPTAPATVAGRSARSGTRAASASTRPRTSAPGETGARW